ncbi:MAG: hypothetical protein R3E01_35910 [Pirellulaceae bacterium]|nr:hypothetical protein [Planctomycetales bacterium]
MSKTPICQWIWYIGTIVVATMWGTSVAQQAAACPFCSAVSQTFAEEMESMDAVVYAELVEAPDKIPEDSNAPLPKCRFRVAEILKGEQWVKPGTDIEIFFFGTPDKSRKYLMMAADPPELIWSTPIGLSDRCDKYLKEVRELPRDPSRLQFFQTHLEDQDEMICRDAFDEFAKAPYEDMIALRESMDRAQIVAWVKDPQVPSERRKLYLTMLGICGTREDADMLEEMIRFVTAVPQAAEPDPNDPQVERRRQIKGGLDALVASYLSLRGDDGMPAVEESLLDNSNAEFSDTYSAILALRFHGTQTERISHMRILEAFRLVLTKPQMADLVIPDLARWEDWSVIPQLVTLFKDAQEEANWVRVPIVNYLQACPLPEAKQQLEELAKIDAEAVRRASMFMPFPAAAAGKPQVADGSQSDGNSNENTDSSVDAAKDLAQNDPAENVSEMHDSAVAGAAPVEVTMLDSGSHAPKEQRAVSSPAPPTARAVGIVGAIVLIGSALMAFAMYAAKRAQG